MWATQNPAHKLTRHVPVGAKPGTSGYFINAIWPYRSRADDLELRRTRVFYSVLHRSGSPHLLRRVHHGTHDFVVSGATTQIAGQPVADLGLIGVRVAIKQGLSSNQE